MMRLRRAGTPFPWLRCAEAACHACECAAIYSSAITDADGLSPLVSPNSDKYRPRHFDMGISMILMPRVDAIYAYATSMR